MRILNEGVRLAGRYTLTRRIGVGGMAEVWLAYDSQTQTSLALKFAGDGAAEKTLLQREWQIGSRLMHANIVRVFEFHDDPDGAFYSLQYVGESHVGELAGASTEELLRPIGLIADALRYAHGKGVVHRDIKASNILLDSRGLPYLIDFGVAAPPGDRSVSGGGSEVASSPQQKAGALAATADDIYALGVLIHELVTGHPPADILQSAREISTRDGRGLAPALQGLLRDMLADDPDHRPDAATVAARIAAAGIAAGPAPARYLAGATALDEVVESVAARKPGARVPGRADSAGIEVGKSGGIAPGVLYGGLAAALALFLAVIFVLPRFVVDEPQEEPGAGVVPAETAPAADTRPLPEPGSPTGLPAASEPAAAGSDTTFNENDSGSSRSEKAATDDALGDLLSQLERLRYRAIDRWGGQEFLDAVDVYAQGDEAYVARNYRLAGERYRTASRMLEPFFNRIDRVFADTLAAAKVAFEAADHAEAIRLFDLARSITPGNREAEAGFLRATNLQAVLSLMDQGETYEADLELAAARLAYEKALQIDALWEPAEQALARVNAAIKAFTFEQRMTEGFSALADRDFDSARAAFEAAKILDPSSTQPADGLQQLDQEIRLADIRRLENEATTYDSAEQWETSVAIYQDILKIDPDLQFAQQGLRFASQRSALHARLSDYINSPDTLSDPVNMQNATDLLLELTRVTPMGPRLEDQKNELSRLLKRAATPLAVKLVSDNMTNVSIFKVGRFGTFASHELSLRPGNYVAVGIRAGYRDVRVEFRVAPEVEMEPILIRCEEPI